jgi:hypothetical protein
MEKQKRSKISMGRGMEMFVKNCSATPHNFWLRLARDAQVFHNLTGPKERSINLTGLKK